MAKIFLSYSRLNKSQALVLAKDLVELSHSTWLDQDLSGGQAWWNQILANIRDCELFIFVLSEAGLHSTACQREYGYAAELGKSILPVLVSDDVSSNLLPPALSQIQFVDYRNRDPAAVIRLARALQDLRRSPPLPDPLPSPPDVPISYLGSLSQQVETTSTLSPLEQSTLVLDLKRALRDPSIKEDTKTLLKRLRVRHDLMAKVADEIDELLAGTNTAQVAHAPPDSNAQTRVAQELTPPMVTNSQVGPDPETIAPEKTTPRPQAQPATLASPKRDEQVLAQIANQRIWLHWLMWFFPIVSWVTCFVSAALIRNVKPIAIGMGVGFFFGILGGATGQQSFVLIGSLFGSAIAAGLTHAEIQRARDELEALKIK